MSAKVRGCEGAKVWGYEETKRRRDGVCAGGEFVFTVSGSFGTRGDRISKRSRDKRTSPQNKDRPGGQRGQPGRGTTRNWSFNRTGRSPAGA
jgi:hypothetical protein